MSGVARPDRRDFLEKVRPAIKLSGIGKHRALVATAVEWYIDSTPGCDLIIHEYPVEPCERCHNL